MAFEKLDFGKTVFENFVVYLGKWTFRKNNFRKTDFRKLVWGEMGIREKNQKNWFREIGFRILGSYLSRYNIQKLIVVHFLSELICPYFKNRIYFWLYIILYGLMKLIIHWTNIHRWKQGGLGKSVHLRYRFKWGFAVSEHFFPTYIWPQKSAVGVEVPSVHYKCKCIVKDVCAIKWNFF